MTWSALALGGGITVLMGGTLLVTPALARPTLPLGVSVPADRVADPAVRRALRGYRRAVLAVTAVALVLAAVLAPVAAEAAVVVPVLLATAGGMAAFVAARRPLMATKAAEDWFAGKPVRMAAAVTDAGDDESRVPVGWYLASVVLLAVTTVVGALRYGDLPDRVPVHWDLAGSPDSFADTTPWTALGPVWTGWAMLALLVVVASVATRSPVRVHPGDPPEHALRRARAQQGAAQWVLGTVAFATTALLCALALDTWLHPEALRWTGVAVALFVVAVVVVTAESVRRYRRALGGADRAPGRAEAPDDDRFWPGGLVYVNRDDPSVWVPKRVGIGWTVNLGSTGGKAVTAALLLVPVLAVIAGVALG